MCQEGNAKKEHECIYFLRSPLRSPWQPFPSYTAYHNKCFFFVIKKEQRYNSIDSSANIHVTLFPTKSGYTNTYIFAEKQPFLASSEYKNGYSKRIFLMKRLPHSLTHEISYLSMQEALALRSQSETAQSKWSFHPGKTMDEEKREEQSPFDQDYP